MDDADQKSARVTVETGPSTATARDDELLIRVPNPRAWLDSQMGSEFSTHMRNAWREQLLALRCLLDAAIDRTEQPPRRGRNRVDISVE